MRVGIFYLTLLLIFSGCSSNKRSYDSNTPDTNTTPQTLVPLQEWHFIYNEAFFTSNAINKDAHIHAQNSIGTYSGKGIKIAIIDDNLDTYHPELVNKALQTYNTIDNSNDVNPKGFARSHGTSVTGIIASNTEEGIKGIAPDAELIFISISSALTDSQVITAFDYAYKNGADIISCSWGTNNVSDIVRDKINRVAQEGRNKKGIPVVFAVGNDNKKIENDESAIENVLGVGAVNKHNKVASYSNYGKAVDIVAPGGEFIGIPTLDISDERGFNSTNYLQYNDPSAFTGTSASTPIVSASIALMLEKDPELTREEIYEILQKNSDKIANDHNTSGHSFSAGYGKINLDRAMSAL